MEAATAGNVSTIELLIAHAADVQLRDNDGVTALMSAASQGHRPACELLITKGLVVDEVAHFGGTALMFAAAGGHSDVVRLMLEHKADVNRKVAATPEYIDQVAKAIADGNEEVEPHKDGVTALMVAAQGGHAEAVRLLLEAGADVLARDDEDQSALLNAVAGNHGDVAYALVEGGADANDVYTDKDGAAHNLLWDAIVVSNEKFAQLLISKGASLEHTDDHLVTPLIQSAHRGLVNTTVALVAAGADPAAANDEGITPLIAASSEGHKEVVDALFAAAGLNVNAIDKDGTTSLMAAAVRGHKEIAVALIGKGADVNTQNSDGHTALMFAYNGRNQVATLLDKYSDFIKQGDSDNNTKIIQDALATHTDIVQALVDAGAARAYRTRPHRDDFDYKPKAQKSEASTTPRSATRPRRTRRPGESKDRL